MDFNWRVNPLFVKNLLISVEQNWTCESKGEIIIFLKSASNVPSLMVLKAIDKNNVDKLIFTKYKFIKGKRNLRNNSLRSLMTVSLQRWLSWRVFRFDRNRNGGKIAIYLRRNTSKSHLLKFFYCQKFQCWN